MSDAQSPTLIRHGIEQNEGPVDNLLISPSWCRTGAVRATMVNVSMSEIPSVPVTELPADFVGETNAILLDVREPDEWAEGHVPGALHIPLADVPARIDEIDPDARLYVICHAGGRSEQALRYLMQRGYEGANVVGGMMSWAQTGRPLEYGSGAGGAGPVPGNSP